MTNGGVWRLLGGSGKCGEGALTLALLEVPLPLFLLLSLFPLSVFQVVLDCDPTQR